MTFKTNDQIWIRDKGSEYEGIIVKIDKKRKKNQFRTHFKGFSKRHDRWKGADDIRLYNSNDDDGTKDEDKKTVENNNDEKKKTTAKKTIADLSPVNIPAKGRKKKRGADHLANTTDQSHSRPMTRRRTSRLTPDPSSSSSSSSSSSPSSSPRSPRLLPRTVLLERKSSEVTDDSDDEEALVERTMTDSCPHVREANINLKAVKKTSQIPDRWACQVCNSSDTHICLACGECFCFTHSHKHHDASGAKHTLYLALNAGCRSVRCLSCRATVTNDTKRKSLDTIYARIQALQNLRSPSSPSAGPRSPRAFWSKVRNSVRDLVPFLNLSAARDRKKEDKLRTMVKWNNYRLLADTFASWKDVVARNKVPVQGTSSDDMPPPMAPMALVRSQTLVVRTKCRYSFAGRCGLRNLGNTCYMNAVLQALCNARLFRDYFYYEHFKKKCGNHEMGSELHTLMRTLWGGKLAQYTPEDLLQKVWEYNPFFAGFKQQDAQEFAAFLLDRLSKEQASGDVDGDGEGKGADLDFVKDLFGGSHESMVTCKSCGYESRTVSKFCGPISVQIPPKDWVSKRFASATSPKEVKVGRSKRRVASLSDCLDYTYADNELEGDNGYRCRGCKQTVSATKTYKLSALPANYLVFQIVRTKFSAKSFRVSKDMTMVDLPFKKLDLEPFAKPGTSRGKYNLFAVVTHKGRSMNLGHYTCLGLRTKPIDLRDQQGDDKWLEYNDKDVKNVTKNTVSKAQAYLLFYERTSLHN